MISAPPFSALSGLIGIPVRDNQGVIVGNVTDILIDHTNGRIAYIQLLLDRSSTDTNQNITLPWSSFRSTLDAPTVLELRVGLRTLVALLAGG